MHAKNAARKGAPSDGTATPERLALLLERFGGKCAYCGAPHEHWDHVVPISRGGEHSIRNLLPSCAPCNLSKGAKTIEEWRHGKGEQPRAPQRERQPSLPG